MYDEINKIKDVNYVKNIDEKELKDLACDIRKFLIDKVSTRGGHLSSNLGVVELTLSLYKSFNFEYDKIIWDVGHQAYVHKILTGRAKDFDTLRQLNGLSGFPKRYESKYDCFETGHSSTSVSAASGMAKARDIKGDNYNVIAVIGDGALTGGMGIEALNDIGFNKSKIIVILNDNGISISKNVGGLSMHLSRLRADKKYNEIKNKIKRRSNKPLGKYVNRVMVGVRNTAKRFLMPKNIFEDMGLKYIGPVDGHNLKELNQVLESAKNISSPVVIHVKTRKGKGYVPAETNPYKFHGVGPFNLDTGEVKAGSSAKSYSSCFGEAIIEIAKEDSDVVAITAAMPDGCALTEFSELFPERFFDVGIAEQHATTMAAGMATQGIKPFFAVYSTFLQRGFDQVLHDVCIQNLPVTFCIDRAGIVGNDGDTHQGVFDLSYLSMIPNIAIMAPKCSSELREMLYFAKDFKGPLAIRYPRGSDEKDVHIAPKTEFKLGEWEEILDGEEIVVIAVGKMVQHAYKAIQKLNQDGINIGLVSASFVKPIDFKMIDSISNRYRKIITIEDNVLIGGFGSSVGQYINQNELDIKIRSLGYKDKFVPHGNVDQLYKIYGLDQDSIYEVIKNDLRS